MNQPTVQPAIPTRPSVRNSMLTMLAAGVCGSWISTFSTFAAAQSPKLRTCSVAVVKTNLLTVNCPKGQLGELLTVLREQIGMASDLSAELAATPVSVVLEEATLQAALDQMLANYNYSLDGIPVIAGGRAGGTKVVVYGLRKAAVQDKRDPPTDAPAPGTEPTRSRYQEETPPPTESPGNDSAQPRPAEPQSAEAPDSSSGMPIMDPEVAAKAREAFFANLPAAGTTLPPGAAQVELPPSRPIQNSTGPGDGRQGLPLPDFTPGPPTQTPPGVSQ